MTHRTWRVRQHHGIPRLHILSPLKQIAHRRQNPLDSSFIPPCTIKHIAIFAHWLEDDIPLPYRGPRYLNQCNDKASSLVRLRLQRQFEMLDPTNKIRSTTRLSRTIIHVLGNNGDIRQLKYLVTFQSPEIEHIESLLTLESCWEILSAMGSESALVGSTSQLRTWYGIHNYLCKIYQDSNSSKQNSSW